MIMLRRSFQTQTVTAQTYDVNCPNMAWSLNKSRRIHQGPQESTVQKVFIVGYPMFIDSAFVLGLVEGPHIPLGHLEKSKPELHIMRAGLVKGLFELARSFGDILQPHLRDAITVFCNVS